MKFALSALALSALLAQAHAQPAPGSQPAPGPQPEPMPPPIAAPKDVAYSGTIRLDVDATDLRHHVFSVHETIPVVQAGDMVLLYPKWLPGTHGPSGAIDKVANIVVHANGQRLAWTRDTVDVYAFHVSVPQGATSLDVSFQFLSATESDQGRIVMTPEMLNLQWISLVLYPAGSNARRIMVEPHLTLPDGWHFATALGPQGAGAVTQFPTVPLTMLTDSPLYAGRHYKRIDLAPGATPPVHLNLFADRDDELEMTQAQTDAHLALASQARKLYQSAHYDHYEFMLSLSDELSGNGLEHHQSSENGLPGTYFTEWDKMSAGRDLLPHEYTHSWNGKFRRPSDLWAANLNEPERDSLLWVYEGQTQYWGQVLAARSGLWTKAQTLDALALDAASMDHQAGRVWRPLQDTTNDPIIQQRRAEPWRNWQRGEDYYVEGLLIWLDADTKIREMSNGQHSMDDFARAFFGVDNGSLGPLTYTFDDVVRTLNDVQPFDWSGFLRERLDGLSKQAPMGGLEHGGYKLVYNDTPNDILKSYEGRRKITDFSFSIGLALGKGGAIKSVQWDSPAFQAGLAMGGEILAIDGIAYGDGDDLKRAIKLAKGGGAPIELLVKSGRAISTVRIEYHDGLRYPHLERVEGTPARIDDIIAPLK